MPRKNYIWRPKNIYIPNEEVSLSFFKTILQINHNCPFEYYLPDCEDLPLYFFPTKYHKIIINFIKYNSRIKIQTKTTHIKTKSIDIARLSKRVLAKLTKKIINEEKKIIKLPRWRQTEQHYADFSNRTFERIINPTKKLFEIVLLARAKFIGRIADKFNSNTYDEKIFYYEIEDLITPVVDRIPQEFKTFDWCRCLVSRCPLLAVVFTEYEYSEYIYDMAIRRKNNFSYNKILSTYKNFRSAYLKFIKSYKITPKGPNYEYYHPWLGSISYDSIKFNDIILDEIPELLLYTECCYESGDIGTIIEKCIEMKRPFTVDNVTMQGIVAKSNEDYYSCTKMIYNSTDMKLYRFTNGQYLTLLAYKDIIIRLFSTKNKFHIPEDCSILILDFIIPTERNGKADLAYEIYEKNGNEHARNTVNNYVNTVYNVLFSLANPVIPTDCINLIITYINKAAMFRRHRVTTTCEEY